VFTEGRNQSGTFLTLLFKLLKALRDMKILKKFTFALSQKVKVQCWKKLLSELGYPKLILQTLPAAVLSHKLLMYFSLVIHYKAS
jgi:hypothetical protein